MHRSGTSVVTRSLECLGVNLGDRLIEAASDNPKGFFEDRDVLSINQRALRHVGSHWHRPPAFEHSGLSELAEDALGRIARRVVSEKARRLSPLAIKDPRLCILLPFWRPVLSTLDLDVSCVIVVRKPFSVAASLRRRNGLSADISLMLWLKYMLGAMTELDASWTLAFTEFETLVSRPRAELARLADTLGLKVNGARLEDFALRFLDYHLYHENEVEGLHANHNDLAGYMYKLLSDVASGAAILESATVAAFSACKRKCCDLIPGDGRDSVADLPWHLRTFS